MQVLAQTVSRGTTKDVRRRDLDIKIQVDQTALDSMNHTTITAGRKAVHKSRTEWGQEVAALIVDPALEYTSSCLTFHMRNEFRA